MKLGFIGTGEITKAVVIGVLGSKIKFQKIYLNQILFDKIKILIIRK